LEQPRNWLLRSCVICGLTLPAFAGNETYYEIDVIDYNKVYEADENNYALTLAYDASYTGSNITLTSTISNQGAIKMFDNATLSLTDSNISCTDFYYTSALYIPYGGNVYAVSLDSSTLTGNINVGNSATLNLSGSNGTVITGELINENDSTIHITLSGADSKFIGNIGKQNGNGSIELTLSDGAAFIGSGYLTRLNLDDGTILGYTGGNPLYVGFDYRGELIQGLIRIGNDILIDFSSVTLEDNQDYTILSWSNAELLSDVSADSFTATNLGPDMGGTFTVIDKTLTFHATAVPEPSTWFLLGTGIALLLLTARRRNVQS
jgi:hypothetical protein